MSNKILIEHKKPKKKKHAYYIYSEGINIHNLKTVKLGVVVLLDSKLDSWNKITDMRNDLEKQYHIQFNVRDIIIVNFIFLGKS